MRKMREKLFLGVFLACAVNVAAASGQIEFTAEVLSTEVHSSGSGLLTMALTSDLSIPIQVADWTEIRDSAGATLRMPDLEAGMLLRIDASFAEHGIVARRIRVLDNSDFTLRGRLESLHLDTRQITLLGFTIEVPGEAILRDREGRLLVPEDLQVDQFLHVSGRVADRLIAETVTVLRGAPPTAGPEKDHAARVSFEGIVSAIEDSQFLVRVDGATETPVRIGPETDLRGVLQIGVRVRVMGTVADDLVVDALVVVVHHPVQLAPNRLQLRPGQTHPVEVILHQRFDVDVIMTIQSHNPSVAQPSVESLIIPAGTATVSFDVVAGEEEGETRIGIAIPSQYRGVIAVVGVRVHSHSSGSAEIEPVQIRWSIEKLRMRTSERRLVRLVMREAAAEPVTARLSVVRGEPRVIGFPASVTIPAGARHADVIIHSGPQPGRVAVIADFGDRRALLEVEVWPEF